MSKSRKHQNCMIYLNDFFLCCKYQRSVSKESRKIYECVWFSARLPLMIEPKLGNILTCFFFARFFFQFTSNNLGNHLNCLLERMHGYKNFSLEGPSQSTVKIVLYYRISLVSFASPFQSSSILSNLV